MEGVVDDVRQQVQKLDSKYAPAVFNSLPQGTGLLQSPIAAVIVAKSVAVPDSTSGHRIASTPWDVGFRVITT
jgi:ABC-type amino acid transport substrate-binding protein